MDLPDEAKGTLETPLGSVTYIVNQADHVYLDAPHELVVNRVRYHVSMHLHLIDGVWKLKNFNELYMRRTGNTWEEASFAARDKTEKILLEAWTEFIPDHPELLVQGEIYALARQVQEAEETIGKLQQQLEEATGARELAIHRLRELGYHGPNKQDWTSRF